MAPSGTCLLRTGSQADGTSQEHCRPSSARSPDLGTALLWSRKAAGSLTYRRGQRPVWGRGTKKLKGTKMVSCQNRSLVEPCPALTRRPQRTEDGSQPEVVVDPGASGEDTQGLQTYLLALGQKDAPLVSAKHFLCNLFIQQTQYFPSVPRNRNWRPGLLIFSHCSPAPRRYSAKVC